MRILIADDEKEIRALFTTILSSNISDSQVDVVVNGAEAVDAFRTGNYDVVLMDIYMPVKNGYEACLEIQEICRIEKLKMPFVIFCTAYAISKEIEKLLEDKIHYSLLQKPVTCEQIIDIFKTIK
jgi:CheY-like chemotaxis protein